MNRYLASIEQQIARLALAKFIARLNTPGEPDPYCWGDERDVLGETESGTYYAPRAGSDDWWEPFDFRKPGHMKAWAETKRSGRVAMLELESQDSGNA